MTALAGFGRDFLRGSFWVLYESGIFILVGFFLAGLLHAYLDPRRITPHLGGRSFRSVVTAALFGAPLPLCSCGVVPTAVALRRGGASREATLSFLISTPETGADAIALTYGLLGPVFAVLRPLTALATALVAGAASLLWGGRSVGACATGPAPAAADPADPPLPARARLAKAFRYGFGELFDDLLFWLLLGIFLTGLVTAAMPEGFLARTLGSGLLSMAVVVLVAVPLYMCASSSTPVAAALLAKGLSPGAALVFLLTGPATNGGTLAVVARVFGRRFLLIYLGSIVGVAVAVGLALNRLYAGAVRPLAGAEHGSEGFLHAGVRWAGLVLFVVLAAGSLRRTGLRPGLREMRENFVTLFRWRRS